MSVQSEHTGSGRIPNRLTVVDTSGPSAWGALSCNTQSLPCSAGEIIVLRVEGEVDLCTLSILQAALDYGLDQQPAHLVVDLARMTFCSARGLDLLTRTGRTTAGKATGYAVSGVPPQIDRVWTLVWDGDLPVRYHSTAAAVTAIRAA
ncbi:MAG TPA: STAS domain-containing protein [Pseudonocardiaceae bacterium]|nr:STAS domain-containing protein [Pseudonocardiaceae bacterium]